MNLVHSPGTFQAIKNIILGSASPRRQSLLTVLGLHFEVRPAAIKEPPPFQGEAAKDYVQRMAKTKVKKIMKQRTDSIIIGSDTIVVLDGKILGKPQNSEQALEMLCKLSGKTHQVLTACCILDLKSKEQKNFTVTTSVTMANWELSVLKAYVLSGEPLDKAGSYAIQGTGGFLVQSIQGSHSNVIGLPLKETVHALLDLQAIQARTKD